MFTPTDLPTFPFAKRTSALAKEAGAIHDRAAALREQVGAIGVEGRTAYDELVQARQALDAQRSAPERDPAAEIALAEKVRTHEVLADPQAFRVRSSRVAQEAESATQTYRVFVRQHGPVLLAELAPEATKTADKLAEAIAALAPLQTARGDVAGRVSALTRCFHNGAVTDLQRWATESDETKPPLPSPQAVAALARELAPAPVPVQPEAALAAGDRTWTF